MIPRPNNRAVEAGDSVTRDGVPVVGVSTRKQVQRTMATVRDILGRDPKRTNLFVGGTGPIERATTPDDQP